MSTSNTETFDSDDEPTSIRSRTIDFITRRTKDGTLPLLAGFSLFVRTIQKREHRGRMVVGGIAAAAVIGIGLYQRRSQRNTSQTEVERILHYEKSGAHQERAESHQPDTNPRGTSDEPDVETKTEPDEGSIQFTEDQEDEIQSPSNPDEEDTTEIDLSDASMADEASEAVGPSSGQSQPTQIDDAEPAEIAQKDDSDDDESEESR